MSNMFQGRKHFIRNMACLYILIRYTECTWQQQACTTIRSEMFIEINCIMLKPTSKQTMNIAESQDAAGGAHRDEWIYKKISNVTSEGVSS